jgi:hypothetical protein
MGNAQNCAGYKKEIFSPLVVTNCCLVPLLRPVVDIRILTVSEEAAAVELVVT